MYFFVDIIEDFTTRLRKSSLKQNRCSLYVRMKTVHEFDLLRFCCSQLNVMFWVHLNQMITVRYWTDFGMGKYRPSRLIIFSSNSIGKCKRVRVSNDRLSHLPNLNKYQPEFGWREQLTGKRSTHKVWSSFLMNSNQL